MFPYLSLGLLTPPVFKTLIFFSFQLSSFAHFFFICVVYKSVFLSRIGWKKAILPITPFWIMLRAPSMNSGKNFLINPSPPNILRYTKGKMNLIQVLRLKSVVPQIRNGMSVQVREWVNFPSIREPHSMTTSYHEVKRHTLNTGSTHRLKQNWIIFITI